MTTFQRIAATLAAFAAFSFDAAANQSDLWFNPQEPGWGVQVSQQGERAFVTLFVYGADGLPTWYVASDAQVIAYDAGGLPLLRGTLYQTRGPFHGGVFDPSAVRVNPVGEIWLEARPENRMRIQYRAEGLTAVKDVVRQSIAPVPLPAFAAAQVILRIASASGVPVGTSHFQADVMAQFEDGAGYLRTEDHLGRLCEYRGPYTQSGKLMRFTGTYTCSAGDSLSGTFELRDLEASANGYTGYLRKSGRVEEYGRIAAVRY